MKNRHFVLALVSVICSRHILSDKIVLLKNIISISSVVIFKNSTRKNFERTMAGLAPLSAPVDVTVVEL